MGKILFDGELKVVDINELYSLCRYEDIDMGEVGGFIIEKKILDIDDPEYKREEEYLGWICYFDVVFQGDYYDSYDYRFDYSHWTVEAYWWNFEEPFIYVAEDVSIEDIEDLIAKVEVTTYEDIVPTLKKYIKILRRQKGGIR